MRLPVLFAACLSLVLAACGQNDPAPKADAEAPVMAPTAEMPVDAPPQEELVPSEGGPVGPVGEDTASAEPGSCLAEIGAQASARLVQRCIAVSPATRPPCNAVNSCEMIQGEIERSCALWTRDGDPPAECAA